MADSPQDSDISSFLTLFENDPELAKTAIDNFQSRSVATRRAGKQSTGPVLVEIEGLSKRYKVGRQHIEALKQANLTVREGEFIAFTGPSGSGKSTLLQLIGGLDKPTSGNITVHGQSLSKLSDRKLSVFRNKTIGFVFQFFYLQPFLNLQTNLEVPGMFARTPRKERAAKANELSTAVDLQDRLKHFPKELSGGQMQRAAIARALLNNPKLLLADEPTGNLDSANGRAIIQLFQEVRQKFGTTIIVVTHDPSVAAQADREIRLKDGELVT